MKTLLLAAILIFTQACKSGSDSSHTEKSTASQSTQTPSTGGTTGSSSGGGGTSGGNSGTVDVTFAEEFMDLVNDHRVSIGLQPVTHSEGLDAIASVHSSNMANGSVAFGHDGFSTRCSQGRAVLGGGNACGENVAMGQKTVQAAFTAWMNSPGHRANIENSRYTHCGLGYKKSTSGTYYWTQLLIEKN